MPSFLSLSSVSLSFSTSVLSVHVLFFFTFSYLLIYLLSSLFILSLRIFFVSLPVFPSLFLFSLRLFPSIVAGSYIITARVCVHILKIAQRKACAVNFLPGKQPVPSK
jgi:hypothetical protein